MMKQEFEKLIGTDGKKQIADLYTVGGMGTIRSMFETADIMFDLGKELLEARAALEKVEARIQDVKENGIRQEQCRRDMLDAFDKAVSVEEWEFAKKLLANRYGIKLVEVLSKELKLS